MTGTSGTAPIANDDAYGVAMNQTLTTAASGLLANDGAPAGETLTAVPESGSTGSGTYAVNSDGSFSYTPNQGFSGVDYFSYYDSANGVESATPGQVAINVANLQLTGPGWVPINANDDNGSAWQANSNNMVPTVRDFDFLRQLPANRTDPQLLPLNLVIAPNPPVGATGLLQLQVASSGTGQIHLWSDQRKTRLLNPGFYPLTGPNSLPATIYVEGIAPTSRTIGAGNTIQANPNPDNTITVTYWLAFAGLPGQPAQPPLPIATSNVMVGVGPVVNFFTINGGPTPPAPALNPPLASNVFFAGDPAVVAAYQLNPAPPNNFSNGWFSFGTNANTQAIIVGNGAAQFDAQVYNNNTPGDLHFIQNVTITNGAGGAFTFAQGQGNAQNLRFIGAGNAVLPGPVLDMNGAMQPGPGGPFYESSNVPAGANLDQITGKDRPEASIGGLVAAGLNTRQVQGQQVASIVTNVNFRYNFNVFLTWQMPAGAGPVGDCAAC